MRDLQDRREDMRELQDRDDIRELKDGIVDIKYQHTEERI